MQVAFFLWGKSGYGRSPPTPPEGKTAIYIQKYV